jgi:AcrR family transcriptional regulator
MTEKRPQQERSKFTFRSILEAADSLLDRNGDGKITTRGIAERAGVSIGSLYQYFRGTDAILKELLQSRVLGDVEMIIAEFDAGDGLTVEERLRRLFRKILASHLETARVRGTLLRRAPGLRLVEFVREKIDRVSAELFQKLKATGQLRPNLNEELAVYLVSRTVFAVTMSAVLDYETLRGKEADVADELALLVSRYLA